MILNLETQIIEIKAKNIKQADYNKNETYAFLNKLALLALEAGNSYMHRDYLVLAQDADDLSKKIYNFLNEEGYYDK